MLFERRDQASLKDNSTVLHLFTDHPSLQNSEEDLQAVVQTCFMFTASGEQTSLEALTDRKIVLSTSKSTDKTFKEMLSKQKPFGMKDTALE
eukprot:483315-Hanusia_phi.AAC.4